MQTGRLRCYVDEVSDSGFWLAVRIALRVAEFLAVGTLTWQVNVLYDAVRYVRDDVRLLEKAAIRLENALPVREATLRVPGEKPE